jgi:hypothetical protein
MEQKMNTLLSIDADWESLSRGSPEEQACFAAIGIRYNNLWLTRAEDAFVGRLRDKVHLSAYRLAEWFAWNWWRLRWEPRNHRRGWALAHRLTTIGGGYVWPNITISSDGERVVLLAKPSQSGPSEPLRYVEDIPAVVRAGTFEDAVDLFVEQVRAQLRAENVGNTNLDDIWSELMAERADSEASERRRLEALLGFDPDEAPPQQIESLVADAKLLGDQPMSEVAAGQEVLSAKQFGDIAHSVGFSASPRDAVRLPATASLPAFGQATAWKRGAEAARALRASEKLGADPIDNPLLAKLAGVEQKALSDEARRSIAGGCKTSFALDENASTGRIVLHSKWNTGRRFELARLLGDRLAGNSGGRLFPATRSYTYRQKLQRSFAAELLCPFEALRDKLHDDVSPEAVEDAAEYFDVSEQTIRTLLVNHGLLGRDELETDVDDLPPVLIAAA